MALEPGIVRVHVERAEARAERLVRCDGDVLIAEEDYLVLDERGADLLERLVVERRQIYSQDLGADRGCERADGDRAQRQ